MTSDACYVMAEQLIENKIPAFFTETQSQDCPSSARVLSEAELAKLKNDETIVSHFKQEKLEQDAKRHWDIFYKRNSTKFFRDRHWTTREFKELLGPSRKDNSFQWSLLEVGCGVGNLIFPLLQDGLDLFIYACDFSPRAVKFVKDNPLYNEARIYAFECDLTSTSLTTEIPPNSIDIITMIFVLSSIHPGKMISVLKNAFQVLKPGGCLLFRDYGLHDYAQLRFGCGHKLAENFYVRQDGTRAYYFSKEVVATLCTAANFLVSVNEYVLRETVNKKKGLRVPRVFIQGKFIKPSSEPCSNGDICGELES